MKQTYDIVHKKYSKMIIFSCELPEKYKYSSESEKLSYAAVLAISNKKGLAGANLRGVDLSNRDLRSAQLYGVDLTDANLRLANLSNANLTAANFTNANLSRVNFRDAFLERIILSGTNSSGSNLGQSIANQENLRRITLEKLARRNRSTLNFDDCDLDDEFRGR